MGSFLTDNIVNIVFGTTTLLSSALALHYKRLEHRRKVEEIIGDGRKAGLFLSREAMDRDYPGEGPAEEQGKGGGP